ncbi:MAG: hypothetical protein A3C88_00995 [Candidatus Yanofskybacteria bacterium RIFCSPHIGHO2_02_FULL_50_12]|uniref:Uncharacterized protein n=3 Tax=Candidatus Yanofskyibacteriota TaxID=1752733 RepID=A0A0G1WI17_9BACT|nr:MAG: hypothetical protein UY20_C0003G0002 [Candidatus Yanofskybacteria bacterium GW2011_GWA1_48_10]OGN06726.1 MAG: hypothetical protein A2669_00115 [Candidatus Yanofskybacteria bacterium RIFCSPHIGHO2_01_FULL_48_25b]OGN17938.1 MAG: hypothetical protein A3C88_00995 [Candidatus Yanofskybacteria bacterium RIFCSPHIGHO2_02_FULL_50_12]
MELIISKKSSTEIELKFIVDGEARDMLIIPLDFNLDNMLVTSIDRIFKKNRISKVSPLEVILLGFDDKSSMATMIAQTVSQALKVK